MKIFKWTKIGDTEIHIADGNYSSKYPRSEEFISSGVPFIRANNLKNKTVVSDDMYFISEEKHSLLLKGQLETNDILITTRGKLGDIALVPVEYDGANINAQIVLLRANDRQIIPDYLKWCFDIPEVRKQINQLSTGTALKQLPVSKLRQIKIPLPPLEEQKRIAAILDKADRVRRKRQEAIRLTEELGRSIFIDMFGDLFAFLTGKQKHDKGFLYCKLGDQITLQRGFDLLKKDCTEGIYPVISSGGIHTYHDRYKAKGPGVLLGRKGSVGRVHYVEEDYWPHDTTLWIKDFNNNNQVFVYHFFRLFPILRFEASTASPTLNRNRLHPLQVFWPDRELQTKFANSISVINKYGNRNSFHFLQSENLFNSLLQRAFRGEL